MEEGAKLLEERPAGSLFGRGPDEGARREFEVDRGVLRRIGGAGRGGGGISCDAGDFGGLGASCLGVDKGGSVDVCAGSGVL